jgi:hypothetical protein
MGREETMRSWGERKGKVATIWGKHARMLAA